MFSTWAVLVYLLAFGLPIWLLYHFHSAPWYWHVLALLAAVAMGFFQTPPQWQSQAFDLAFGAVFILLATWGIGGLLAFRWHGPHHEKHA